MKRTVGNIPNGAKFAAAARICLICIDGIKRRKAKSGEAETKRSLRKIRRLRMHWVKRRGTESVRKTENTNESGSGEAYETRIK